jgi:hypothetical protein
MADQLISSGIGVRQLYVDTGGGAHALAVAVVPAGAGVGVSRTVTANAAGGGDTDQALTATTTRISMVALGSAIRYVVGTGSLTAGPTSHLILQNERLTIAVPAGASISVISNTATPGTLEITEYS